VSRILIVEDEPALASILQDYLRQAGMDADVLNDGTDAVATILAAKPDLVVLDIMLPGKDGLTICRELRAVSDVPIILETAKVEEIDRLLGLELGADDYLCKPFSPRELVARVKAILRRVDRQARPPEEGGLVLDADQWIATLGGKPLELTRREFQLLSVLTNRPGRVFSRAQLLDGVWGNNVYIDDRTVDVHVGRLRKALNRGHTSDPIRTVRGSGYALNDRFGQTV
jgi:two-component system response regulator BaeR